MPMPVDFAILALLCEHEGETQLLFELRAQNLRNQPGEVCFPGGRIDPGETAQEAALRECFEETGLRSEKIGPLQALPPVVDRFGRPIAPFWARVQDFCFAELSPNRAEVAELFLIPLRILRAQKNEDSYNAVYEHAGKTVWGLTARTVHRLLQLLCKEGL